MDQRKVFSVSADLAARIDDYRYTNRIPTESEALRRLVEAGLQAESRRELHERGNLKRDAEE